MSVTKKTAAEWSSSDPLLTAGELGLETDTGNFKLGTGWLHWSSLTYLTLSLEYFAPATPGGGDADDSGTEASNFDIGDGSAGSRSITFHSTFDTVVQATPTAGRTLTLPDADGELVYAGGPLVIENRTSDPSTPATGRIWLRTDL